MSSNRVYRFSPIATVALTICAVVFALAAFGCANQSNDEASFASSSASTDPTVTVTESSDIPDSSTGEQPSTPEELQLAQSAADVLGVPYNGKVICTIGEAFYSEDLGQVVRSVSFYENDKLVAGADFAEDGTAVANVVYY